MKTGSFTKIFFVFLILFTSLSTLNTANSQQQEKYSLVKISISGTEDIKKINQEGLHFDHVEHLGDGTMQAWLSETEISMLKKSGIPYSIVVEDGLKDFLEKNRNINHQEMDQIMMNSISDYNVTHNIYGSMGGYLTYAEVVTKLDSMRIQYPNLISEKFSIGNSTENRAMWTVRMSNTPNVTSGKPEVWYHSLIHAREPESMMQMIYFMYWLLENYNTDPVATYILNNRELYFTPVFNPDGYEYNRSTQPGGGGMWRKNRRNNGDNTFGVDLNRNYGPYAFWNAAGGGSSTSTSSDTYRGISPFSEPETQNAMNFVNSRNFKNILSYHTYGNYMIRPWGHQDNPTPDEAFFQEMSTDLTLQNHYTVGRSMQTVNYTVRGVTDDWYYQDSGHAKIMSMTPEVGSSTDGFWPSINRILPLAMENVSSNAKLALYAAGYATVTEIKLNSFSYSALQNGNLKIYFKNKGLAAANNVTIEITSESPQINFTVNNYSYTSLASGAADSITAGFTISTSAQNNYGYKVNVKVKQEGNNVLYSRDVYICMGNGTVTFSDDAENGFSKWINGTGSGSSWNTSTLQSNSPTRSFADSPTGNYSSNTNRSMIMNLPVNTTSYPVTLLSFWRKQTMDIMDYVYVEVSKDNGVNWTTLRSYSGNQSSWIREILDITEYANGSASVKVKFTMRSNGMVQADGVYIDDIMLTNYNMTATGITGFDPTVREYSLSQNYPNPFNPTTDIKFSIARKGFVSLKVFDNLGREVADLINEEKSAGIYNINFDASKLSTGVYFYKLESGDFRETRKMLLIK